MLLGMAKPKSLGQVRSEIAGALTEAGALVWASANAVHLHGVCLVPLQVKVEFTKSVFSPLERIEKRRLGQFFVVRAVPMPKDDDPDLSMTEEEVDLERKYGVVVVVATGTEDALARLRGRGLPV